MNKPVELRELGMSERREKPKGVRWPDWRRHWHALIATERLAEMRSNYALAESTLRERL